MRNFSQLHKDKKSIRTTFPSNTAKQLIGRCMHCNLLEILNTNGVLFTQRSIWPSVYLQAQKADEKVTLIFPMTLNIYHHGHFFDALCLHNFLYYLLRFPGYIDEKGKCFPIGKLYMYLLVSIIEMNYLGEVGYFSQPQFTQENLLELSETLIGWEVKTINVHLVGCRHFRISRSIRTDELTVACIRPTVVMTALMMMSDRVSGTAGTNDTPHNDNDDSTGQESQTDSLIPVYMTVISHSINCQKNNLELTQCLSLLLNQFLEPCPETNGTIQSIDRKCFGTPAIFIYFQRHVQTSGFERVRNKLSCETNERVTGGAVKSRLSRGLAAPCLLKFGVCVCACVWIYSHSLVRLGPLTERNEKK